jgi:acyl-coenzyme A thioesterase PaaI-like protein
MNIVKPGSHKYCFACGEKRSDLSSLQLTFAVVSENRVACQLHLGDGYQGYTGVMHGGVISTLLDSAMTHCLFAKDIEAMTAKLNIRFIKPVPINHKILLEAEVCSNRRCVYNLTSAISLDGEVLAKGDAKFITIKT